MTEYLKLYANGIPAIYINKTEFENFKDHVKIYEDKVWLKDDGYVPKFHIERRFELPANSIEVKRFHITKEEEAIYYTKALTKKQLIKELEKDNKLYLLDEAEVVIYTDGFNEYYKSPYRRNEITGGNVYVERKDVWTMNLHYWYEEKNLIEAGCRPVKFKIKKIETVIF